MSDTNNLLKTNYMLQLLLKSMKDENDALKGQRDNTTSENNLIGLRFRNAENEIIQLKEQIEKYNKQLNESDKTNAELQEKQLQSRIVIDALKQQIAKYDAANTELIQEKKDLINEFLDDMKNLDSLTVSCDWSNIHVKWKKRAGK